MEDYTIEKALLIFSFRFCHCKQLERKKEEKVNLLVSMCVCVSACVCVFICGRARVCSVVTEQIRVTLQPQSQHASEGARVVLACRASGPAGLAYRWFRGKDEVREQTAYS